MCIATQIKCKHSKPTDTTPKNSSNQQIAHLHITPQNTHFQQKSTIQKLPSREGQGVCHVRAQLPQIKCYHTKPRNATSPNSSKIISSQPAPLTVTHPSIPSQEGKPPHHKPLITKQKAVPQNSPLERGWGCVTFEHSHFKPKHPPKANKPHLKKTPHPTPLTKRKTHHPEISVQNSGGRP